MELSISADPSDERTIAWNPSEDSNRIVAVAVVSSMALGSEKT
jgi:hypothetical protein